MYSQWLKWFALTWGSSEARRAESRGGVLERGQRALSPPAKGCG